MFSRRPRRRNLLCEFRWLLYIVDVNQRNYNCSNWLILKLNWPITGGQWRTNDCRRRWSAHPCWNYKLWRWWLWCKWCRLHWLLTLFLVKSFISRTRCRCKLKLRFIEVGSRILWPILAPSFLTKISVAGHMNRLAMCITIW